MSSLRIWETIMVKRLTVDTSKMVFLIVIIFLLSIILLYSRKVRRRSQFWHENTVKSFQRFAYISPLGQVQSAFRFAAFKRSRYTVILLLLLVFSPSHVTRGPSKNSHLVEHQVSHGPSKREKKTSMSDGNPKLTPKLQ
jgi:hypothetical protein